MLGPSVACWKSSVLDWCQYSHRCGTMAQSLHKKIKVNKTQKTNNNRLYRNTNVDISIHTMSRNARQLFAFERVVFEHFQCHIVINLQSLEFQLFGGKFHHRGGQCTFFDFARLPVLLIHDDIVEKAATLDVWCGKTVQIQADIILECIGEDGAQHERTRTPEGSANRRKSITVNTGHSIGKHQIFTCWPAADWHRRNATTAKCMCPAAAYEYLMAYCHRSGPTPISCNAYRTNLQ